MQKAEIIALLDAYDLQAIIEVAKQDRSIIRMLISLVYDKQHLLSWRAIEAIGLVSGEIAKTNVDMIRNLSQRFLWMMRDESGNGPGSAPELLGEIVRNSPDAFADIGQVVTSFHDELMLRRGVMRAIWRMTEKRPDLLNMPKELMAEKLCLRDEDPYVRAYALMITGVLGMQEFFPVVKSLESDESPVELYESGKFRKMTVSEISRKITAAMTAAEKKAMR